MTTQTELLREAAKKVITEWYKLASSLPQNDAVEALEWNAMHALRAAVAQPEQPAPQQGDMHHWPQQGGQTWPQAEQAQAAKPIPLVQQIRESVLLSPVNPPMLRIHGVNAGVLERAAKRWHVADEAAKPETQATDWSGDPSTQDYSSTQPVPVGINGLTEAETSATASVMGLAKPETANEGERADLILLLNSLASDATTPRARAMRKAAALLSADSKDAGEPVDMVLYCPKCHTQHIDKPEGQFYPGHTADESVAVNKLYGMWDNPPHKSHLCHGCGHIWRPSDTPTNGVERTASGKDADTRPQAADAQPLTETQVYGLQCAVPDGTWFDAEQAGIFERGIRAAERAHGITGKDNAS